METLVILLFGKILTPTAFGTVGALGHPCQQGKCLQKITTVNVDNYREPWDYSKRLF